MTWTYLTTNKHEVASFVPNFLAYVKTQFDSVIKVIRYDDGMEFNL